MNLCKKVSIRFQETTELLTYCNIGLHTEKQELDEAAALCGADVGQDEPQLGILVCEGSAGQQRTNQGAGLTQTVQTIDITSPQQVNAACQLGVISLGSRYSFLVSVESQKPQFPDRCTGRYQ